MWKFIQYLGENISSKMEYGVDEEELQKRQAIKKDLKSLVKKIGVTSVGKQQTNKQNQPGESHRLSFLDNFSAEWKTDLRITIKVRLFFGFFHI